MRKILIVLVVMALILSVVSTLTIGQEEASSNEKPGEKPNLRLGTGLRIERFATLEGIADLPLGDNFLRVEAGLTTFYEGSLVEGSMASGIVIKGAGIFYPRDLHQELLGFGIDIGGGVTGAMVSAQTNKRAEGITYFPLALTVRTTTDTTLVLSIEPYKAYDLWFEAGLNVQLGKVFIGPSIGVGVWF